jgi:hypothetical protein
MVKVSKDEKCLDKHNYIDFSFIRLYIFGLTDAQLNNITIKPLRSAIKQTWVLTIPPIRKSTINVKE